MKTYTERSIKTYRRYQHGMPQIPSNWQMVTISDVAGNSEGGVDAAPRSQKRKTTINDDGSSVKRSRMRTDSACGAGGVGGANRGGGGSGRARGIASVVAAVAAAAAVSEQLPLHEATVATHNKQDIIADIVNAQADTKYRNEIRARIELSVLGVLDREAQIQGMVEQVSKNMHSIIEMSDYKSVLQGVNTKQIIYTSDIRSVSKSYEDTYLRQPVAAGERECVRGEHCECMCIDASQPFVGVEYLLPWEGKKEAGNGMCLPCIRAATQALFYDILHSGLKISGLVQKFYNEHSCEGEYRLSAMLFCPPSGPVQNLPMPVMRHQRNFYKVSVKNSVHFMEQVGVDFQSAPCM